MSPQTKRFKQLGLISLGLAAVVAGLFWVGAEDIERAVKQQLTSDMFVTNDRDAFDPGLPIGARFPSLSARLNVIPVSDISRLMGDKGMIFIAVRSVDW
jgi:hypothetical protein